MRKTQSGGEFGWRGTSVKMLTQVSQGELNKNRKLMWTKRGKACLILIFSTNTNRESMAYRSFRSEEYSARGVRKVTTGTTFFLIGSRSR